MKATVRLLLFPLVLTLHNLEEVLFLPQWTQKQDTLSTLSQTSFTITVLLITLLAYTLWGLLWIPSWREKAEGYLMGYVGAMTFNIFFPHILGSLIYKTLLPGTTTALLCILPTSIYLCKKTTLKGKTVVLTLKADKIPT